MHMQVVWFIMVLCCIVGRCARVASHQGSTLSDLSLVTGFGPFNRPTCGPYRRGGTTPMWSLVSTCICLHCLFLWLFACCCLLSSLCISHLYN